MRPIDKLRRAVAGKQGFDDAVARKRVAEFIADARFLASEEGPSGLGRLVDAPEDAEPRVVAYLFVWGYGPTLQVWVDLERFECVDLLIDAVAEGIDSYLAERARR